MPGRFLRFGCNTEPCCVARPLQGSKADKNQEEDDDEHVLPKPHENGKPKVDDDCNMGGEDCDGDDHTGAVDPDKVVMVGCYKNEELGDELDFKFRTIILFLPQCGVFYCTRERRCADVGVTDTLILYNMAWLHMHREEIPGVPGVNGGLNTVRYSFGEGGYVKRFAYSADQGPPRLDTIQVSAYRISLHRTLQNRKNRIIYWALQCHDAGGPMMPPDVFNNKDAGWWAAE